MVFLLSLLILQELVESFSLINHHSSCHHRWKDRRIITFPSANQPQNQIHNSCCNQGPVVNLYNGNRARELSRLTTTRIFSEADNPGLLKESSSLSEEITNNKSKNKIKHDCTNNLNVYLFTFPTLYYPMQKSNRDGNYTYATTPNSSNSSSGSNNDEDMNNVKLSKHLTLLKQWKYHVLGDGGVYFDQRPNTLSTLNSLILERLVWKIQYGLEQYNYTNHDDYVHDVECTVISTCKRFEILISIEAKVKDDNHGIVNNKINRDRGLNSDNVKNIIASILAEQIAYQRRRLRILRFIPFITSLPLDRPSRVINAKTIRKNQRSEERYNNLQRELQQRLSDEILVVHGVHDVALRLLTLASGLLDRPIFRPFSSRDAHIMNQLKRSLHGSKRIKIDGRRKSFHYDDIVNNGMANTKYSKILLDSALQAGKASRNSKVVPILDELRLVSNGADGPVELSAKAATSAKALAIDPILYSCVEKFKASEASDLIASFREDVEKMTRERGLSLYKEDGKHVRRIIHEPMVNLRQGKAIDMDAIFESIEREIKNK